MANKLQKVVNKPKGKKQTPVPVKIVYDKTSDAPTVDNKWRAQDALRTLAEAARIQKDKDLMRAVKAEAKNQIKSLSTVCK